MSNLKIFTGHFGSGKTEIALNTVFNEAYYQDRTIVDLDVVNPFYRSSELKSVLEAEGIRLIAPNFAHTNMDLPSLPAEIQSCFMIKEGLVVLDIGGDDDGAKVLGVYNQYLKDRAYEMYFVFNTRRTNTDTLDKLLQMIRVIEERSRLKVTHLICNSNLGSETDVETIQEGIAMGIELSKATHLELVFVGVEETFLAEAVEELISQTYEIDVVYKPLKLYVNKWHGRH